MKFRAIDTSGNWVFGTGLQAYAQNQGAIALSIQTRLLMILNDCFFSPTGWIDWFNLLGSKNETSLIFSIRAMILNTPGVNSLTELSVNLNPTIRSLTCYYSVTTIYGLSIINSVVFPLSPFSGISKFVGDIFFNGSVTSVTVNISTFIDNAQQAIWMVYDESTGYDQVVGAVSVLNSTTVTITINPAPPAGFFRLVGIS